MGSKRNLKKALNYACSEAFAECMVASFLTDDKEKKEQAEVVLVSILKIHDDFVRRVSHPEPGLKTSKYYNLLKEDFNKAMIEIADHIQSISA